MQGGKKGKESDKYETNSKIHQSATIVSCGVFKNKKNNSL